jgi:hypothetical protein
LSRYRIGSGLRSNESITKGNANGKRGDLMERNSENMRFCRVQINRFEGTAYFTQLTSTGLGELADALCDLNESQAAAELMVSMRRRDASLTRQGEPRGSICPTPADFAVMAEVIAREKSYQQPWKPTDSPEPGGCTRCNGSGWEIIYSLHTREHVGTASAYVRKQSITKEVFDSFNGGKLDPRTQAVYSGAIRCNHENQPKPVNTSAADRAQDAAYTAFAAQFDASAAKKQAGKGLKRVGDIMRDVAKKPKQPYVELPREPGDESEVVEEEDEFDFAAAAAALDKGGEEQ